MDRVTVSICRIYVALNALQTANLSEKELEELEQNVVGIIDRATHRRTPKMLKQKPQKDSESKENNKKSLPVADGPEQHTVTSAPSLTPDAAPHTISDTSNTHPTKDKNYSPAKEISDPVKDKPEKTEQKKRVRWDCNTCVSKCDKELGTSGVCNLCEDVFERMGKTNAHYQRKPKDLPDNCKKCGFLKYVAEVNKYVCGVYYREYGSNRVHYEYIRANYLNKNRPGYCKLTN